MSTEEGGEAARPSVPVVPPARPPAPVVPPAVLLSAVGLHGVVVPLTQTKTTVLFAEYTTKSYSDAYFKRPPLTFDKALGIALSAEAADKDSKRLTGGTENKNLSAPIEHVKDRPYPKHTGQGNRHKQD